MTNTGTVSEKRTKHLLGILARENSKMGTIAGRTPAVFREMQLDTHKSMQPEYFGPSPDLLPPGHQPPPDYLSQLKTARATAKTASLRASTGQMDQTQQGPVEYRSVFRPRPGQEHVCDLTTQHRSKVAASEWALIDTLEVQLCNQDKERRERLALTQAAEQRKHLDKQMNFKKSVEEMERQDREREAALIRSEVEAFKAEEAAKTEAARIYNMQSKKERKAQLEATRAARQLAQQKKAEEEAAILADCQAHLDADRAAAAAKFEQLKLEAAKTRIDNEARIQAKKDALMKQRQADTELMAANIRLMDKKAAEREAEHEAFHAMIAARTRGAGTKAMDDNRAMLEREARLMKELEEKRDREAEQKAEATRQKKEKYKVEEKKGRQEFLSLQQQRAAELREEARRIREEAEAKAREEMEAQDRKMAAIRERALATKGFLTMQMMTKEMKAVDDGVGMTAAERKLNQQLINQAEKIVAQPKQLTVHGRLRPTGHRSSAFNGRRVSSVSNGSLRRWSMARWLESKAEIEVPVPLEDAWSLWDDREKIPLWMPWIKSVKVQEQDIRLSRWTLSTNQFGRDWEFSWIARNLAPIKNQKIHWISEPGSASLPGVEVANKGQIRFVRRGPKACLVTLSISYEVPNVLVPFANALNPVVEGIISKDMERFKEFALKK